MPDSVPEILAAAIDHHNANRLAEAEALYRQALGVQPNHADALHLLGMVALQTGRLDAAEAAIGQAIAVNPVTPHYRFSLGNVLARRGRLAGALASFDQAIALKPDFAEAHGNRGSALVGLGRQADAAAAFRRAVELRPDYADAYKNLGILLCAMGRLEEAGAACRQAIALRPDFAEAHLSLGNVLRDQGNLTLAADCFRQAITVRPDYADGHNNLANTLKDRGDIAGAVAHYARAVALNPDDLLAHSNLLFCQNYLPDRFPAVLRAMASRFGALVTSRVGDRAYRDWAQPAAGVPLRVGLVSSDLRAHPVGFFLEAFLRASDPARIAFVAFPSRAGEDAVTLRLKPLFVGWHPIYGLDDAGAAACIHASGVRILIDLSGHTAHNRLPVFAWRPAPVQVTWLGYFATTGVAEIDFILGDPHVAPANEEDHFTETVWRLPESYLCFTPPEPAAAVSALPALSRGYVTFGCFNTLAKINDAVVAVWVRILRAVPNSRLVLKASQFTDAAIRSATAVRFGPVADRLVLEPPSARGEYLRAYQRIDIALDPFPYPGGTTSCEALWMGVPVLTRRGDRFLAHAGETIVGNAGLADWIAADDDDYVAKAVGFAADLPRLAGLRAGLRDRVLASPLFDAPRFARHFQAAMEAMWARWSFAAGLRHQQAGHLDRAAAAIGQAVALDPESGLYRLGLGSVRLAQGRLEEALADLDRAVALRPDLSEVHNNRGTALIHLGRREEAAAAFGRAAALKPDDATAHNNLANVLWELGRLEEGAASSRTALALRDDYAEGHKTLGNILTTQGFPARALPHFSRSVALNPDDVAAHSNLLFCLNYVPGHPPEEMLALVRHYGEMVGRRVPRRFAARVQREPGTPLRVGVVSGDLNAHPVGFFLEALVRAADPQRMVFLAFLSRGQQDAQTGRLKPWFVAWQPIHGLTDAAAAELIHRSGVHILIDLSGHTAHNRLPVFAWRPAPVQASWLGYFATTGVPGMDYVIGDPRVSPEHEAHHFTESICRLPETYLCYTPPAADIVVSPLPALANGFVTFGCFNNLTKLTDDAVAVWSRILRSVPASRLVLKSRQLTDSAVRASVLARFAAYGIDASRIGLEMPASREDYLRAYHEIDIALDPFPYPGGTTSVEALWMGVPVLTKRGDRFVSHLGETILANAGLPDWIAADSDDYVARAVAFASDTAALAGLRAGLRDRVLASPLFDAPRFARHFEAAMLGLWTRWLFTEALRLQQSERLEEAEALYLRILAESPDHADALHNLGLLRQQTGRLDEAAEIIARAVAVRPGIGQYRCSLGTVHAARGSMEEALACFSHSIALLPDLPEAHFNLGSTLSQLARPLDAVAAYRRAVALRPEFADARHNLAMALLALGEWDEGWAEYEWRWKTSHMRPDVRDFAQPRWQGELGGGRTLLIAAEQGFGDTLQFCRLAPLAAAHGFRVVLEVQAPLVRLLASLPGIDRVVARGQDLPAFDLWCPMLSLPLALRMTPAAIPDSPYLRADPLLVEQIGQLLGPRRGLRVGLARAGSGALAADRRRSVAPERLAGLAAVPGVEFVSLQKGGAAAAFALTDVMDRMRDFADTAALIANLDLVISVDTAVAHLAGALGKPVWLLNRFDSCWRWMTDRTDSAWYPGMRIYRQPEAGDWGSVLAGVVRDLAAISPK